MAQAVLFGGAAHPDAASMQQRRQRVEDLSPNLQPKKNNTTCQPYTPQPEARFAEIQGLELQSEAVGNVTESFHSNEGEFEQRKGLDQSIDREYAVYKAKGVGVGCMVAMEGRWGSHMFWPRRL